MAVEDCIFCKIIAGEVPAAKVIDTKNVISFLDINPVNPGHCLVVPKRHVETLIDLDQNELHNCIFTAQRVARAAMEVTDSPGLNLLQNNHSCAGQLVDHVHFHVIPRSPDDGFSLGWRQGEYAEGELEELQKKIESRL